MTDYSDESIARLLGNLVAAIFEVTGRLQEVRRRAKAGDDLALAIMPNLTEAAIKFRFIAAAEDAARKMFEVLSARNRCPNCGSYDWEELASSPEHPYNENAYCHRCEASFWVPEAVPPKKKE